MSLLKNRFMKNGGSEHFKVGGVNVNIDFNDILFFIGLGLLTTGLWIYSPAVSLTVTGAILMLAAYARTASGGEKD